MKFNVALRRVIDGDIVVEAKDKDEAIHIAVAAPTEDVNWLPEEPAYAVDVEQVDD